MLSSFCAQSMSLPLKEGCLISLLELDLNIEEADAACYSCNTGSSKETGFSLVTQM